MGTLFLIIVMAPAASVSFARYVGKTSANRLARLAAVGSIISLVGAILSLVATTQGMTQPLAILGISPAIVGIYVDRLSALMLFVVTVIGAVVLRYSVRYLDGDPRQDHFMWLLAVTITSVQLLVLASNLLMFFLAWLAVSLFLHRLLRFYSERTAAIACARKKFLVSRIGDVALVAGISLTYWSLGTLDFGSLFQILATTPSLTGSFVGQLIALLFAIGAMTKSAQLPFHSWLPDSLEVPTPVSALMHAGIINAGGFLLIRLNPIFQEASCASALLSITGALTALYGMSVMVTQTSIKRRLAYSTVGQMGFMIMQCGLGLYHLALLHIVAHAFYKAYAFLRAGSAIEQAHQQMFFPEHAELSLPISAVIGVGLVSSACYLGCNALFQESAKVAYFPIIAVWLLASFHLLLGAALAREGKLTRFIVAAVMASAMACMYFLLSNIFFAYIGPAAAGHADANWGLALTLVMLFLTGFVLHISMGAFGQTATGKRFFIHLHNGFYLGVLSDNSTKRFWSACGLKLI